MNATRIDHYFAGEQSPDYPGQTVFRPALTCQHKHATRESAETCAAEHPQWDVYAELNDGQVVYAPYPWQWDQLC